MPKQMTQLEKNILVFVINKLDTRPIVVMDTLKEVSEAFGFYCQLLQDKGAMEGLDARS